MYIHIYKLYPYICAYMNLNIYNFFLRITKTSRFTNFDIPFNYNLLLAVLYSTRSNEIFRSLN